ncbi:hypothetical protein ACSSVY_001965 [Roseovarius sp. MBR-51]
MNWSPAIEPGCPDDIWREANESLIARCPARSVISHSGAPFSCRSHIWWTDQKRDEAGFAGLPRQCRWLFGRSGHGRNHSQVREYINISEGQQMTRTIPAADPSQLNGADLFKIRDLTVPPAGPRDARVKPLDHQICRGDQVNNRPPPAVAGHGFCGVVDGIGGNVKEFAAGEERSCPRQNYGKVPIMGNGRWNQAS